MTSPVMDVGKKVIVVILIVSLIFSSGITLSMLETVDAPSPPDIVKGNIVVTNGSTVYLRDYNETQGSLGHTGNIIVNESSTLIILNSHVILNQDKFINVTDSSTLKIENSIIVVNIYQIPTYSNLIFNIINSKIEILNSSLFFPGTFMVTMSDFTAKNSNFDHLPKLEDKGSQKLFFNSSNVYYEDCKVDNFYDNDDIFLFGSTNFTAINTYFDLDYNDKMVMYVDNDANAELYGVTVNPGTIPFLYPPIEVINTSSWVNVYRWLYLNVTDQLGIPLGDGRVVVRNLTDHYIAPPKQYILDYLDKDINSYNITNSSGYVILPLLSDNLTINSMPNSFFVGNYNLTALYTGHNTSMNLGLTSYPLLTKKANNPYATISFKDLLISPKKNTYFTNTPSDIVVSTGQVGTIRNSMYQKPQGGVVNMTFGQQGNIIVNGTGPGGILNLISSKLGLEQEKTKKYYILLENDGEMQFSEDSAIMDGTVAKGTYPINIYMYDTSEMVLRSESTLEDIGVLGMDSGSILTLDSSSINGNLLYVNGMSQNVKINAINNSQINMSDIDVYSAKFNIENSNISTISKPVFRYVNMRASNSSFNHDLTFSENSEVKLINVSKPGFFKITALDDSEVEAYWWLTVVVKDSQGNLLQNAKVLIERYNTQAQLEYYSHGYTDEKGMVSLPVMGGKINKTGKLYGGIHSNYFVSATYEGSTSNSSRGSTRSNGGINVFEKNQEVEIVIPGKPDLTFEEVTHSTPAMKNNITKINATLVNSGNFSAFDIEIEFWDTDLGIMLGDSVVDQLKPEQKTFVEISYKFTEAEDYIIQIVVDPEDMINELDETNNVYNSTIEVESFDKPDLVIIPDSLYTNPVSPISNNSKMTIGAWVKNVGTLEAYNFNVRYLVDFPDPGPKGIQLGTDQMVTSLKPNEADEVLLDMAWIINGTGNYRITVIIDPGDLVNEFNENNNSAFLDITVVVGPDLTVTNIVFSDPEARITRETKFSITATVKNVGESDSVIFDVGFHKNSLGYQIGQRVNGKELIPGESTDVTFSVDKDLAVKEFSTSGKYTIYVDVDPLNKISETNEDNNTFSIDLFIIKKADLSISKGKIQPERENAENGVDLRIDAIIANIGDTDSMNFEVRFFDGDINKGEGVQIGFDISLNGLAANEETTVSVIWNSTEGGWHDIWVQILQNEHEDQESTINDKAFRSIYVLTKPDLAILNSDIVTDKDDVEILLGHPVEITLKFRNDGDTSATNFTVEIWDGPRDTIGSEEITKDDKIEVELLSGGREREISRTGYFFTAGNHFIFVYLDPDNRINEISENNNSAFHMITVNESAPDLAIYEETIGVEILPWVEHKDGSDDEQVQTILHEDTIRFEFQITNIGTTGLNFSEYDDKDIRNITVQIFIDKDLMDEIAIIDLFTEKNVTTMSTYKPLNVKTSVIVAKYSKDFKGYHKVTIKIDPNDIVRETKEENNLLEIPSSYRIIKANVEIKEIEIKNQDGKTIYTDGEQLNDPNKGDYLTVYVTVENLGSETVAVDVTMVADGFEYEPYHANISAQVDTESSNEKTFTLDELEVGKDLIAITIEVVGTYGDFAEIEKTVTEDVNIIPKGSKTIEDSPLIPLWLLIIIIAIVIIVVLLVVFLFINKKKRDKMAECSECGALIPVDADECLKCGAEFSDEIECGECGALMKTTDTECPVCGAVFAKESGKAEEEGEPEEELAPEQEGELGEQFEEKVEKPKGKKGKKPKSIDTGKPPASAPPATQRPEAPTPPAIEPGPGQDVEMEEEFEEKAECYNCGAIVPLSASMCPECGAEFE